MIRMGRLRWVWWVVLAFVAFVASPARNARAADFSVIRVCVRPPNLAPDLAAWAYTPSGAGFAIDPKDFKKRYPNVTVYLFDPVAPADSPKLLPIPYNKLECPARVLPVKPIASPDSPPDPKKAAPPKAAESPSSGGGPDRKKDKAKGGDEPPPGTPPPLVYPQAKPPELYPKLPSQGVTANWPHHVLPMASAANRPASVLPTVGVNGGGVLPFKHAASSEPAPAAQEAKADGTGKGTGTGKGGVEKTPFEKFAEEAAYAGAIANQQFNEPDKVPNGSRYGIPGGKNPDGPKSPVAQAAAGGTLVVIAIVGASGLDKKLMDALKKKTPLILKGGGKVAEEAAEKFVESQINTHKDAGRHIVADALNKNGAIGEYSVMKKFTDKLGGQVQAHHLLEQKFVKKFALGEADRVPSVILTDAEHKAITAKLKIATAHVETPQQLWQAYQDAYVDHPSWLAAIKSYFFKAK